MSWWNTEGTRYAIEQYVALSAVQVVAQGLSGWLALSGEHGRVAAAPLPGRLEPRLERAMARRREARAEAHTGLSKVGEEMHVGLVSRGPPAWLGVARVPVRETLCEGVLEGVQAPLAAQVWRAHECGAVRRILGGLGGRARAEPRRDDEHDGLGRVGCLEEAVEGGRERLEDVAHVRWVGEEE